METFASGSIQEQYQFYNHNHPIENERVRDGCYKKYYESGEFETLGLFKKGQKEGKWIFDKRFKNRLLVDQQEIWESNTVKRKEVERLSTLGFKKFYFTPSYLFKLTKILRKLPLERKARMLKTGFDYFLKRPLNFNKKIERETHQWV